MVLLGSSLTSRQHHRSIQIAGSEHFRENGLELADFIQIFIESATHTIFSLHLLNYLKLL